MEKVMERHGISKVKKSMNLETSPVESICITISFLAVADIPTAVENARWLGCKFQCLDDL